MTGPEHYLEAERALAVANAVSADRPADGVFHLGVAQVHACLAVAAAVSSMGYGEMALRNSEAWDRVCGVKSPCQCQGRSPVTTGMVCQACGRDYGGGSDG